jgi:hypothetical protein
MMQATVDAPPAGIVNVGGETVYVYTHGNDVPVQSVYVHVYVFVPEQTGSGPTTGPVLVKAVPHELFTIGGVGTTCALIIQATVEDPAAGITNVGALIVYVYTQSTDPPEQSLYVQVYIFVPEQTGSGPTTGPVGVTGVPHELFTTGGVGTVCALLIHATVDPPGAGRVTVGALMVYVYTHGNDVPVQSV